MMVHWIWTLIFGLVLLWYVIVTMIVAVKGGKDILNMIRAWQKEELRT